MFEVEGAQLKEYAQRLHELHRCLNVEGTKAEIARIEQDMTAPTFWDDPESAQKVMQRLKGLRSFVSAPNELSREIEDALVLHELANSESDASLGPELAGLATTLGEKLDRLEIDSLFTDP